MVDDIFPRKYFALGELPTSIYKTALEAAGARPSQRGLSECGDVSMAALTPAHCLATHLAGMAVDALSQIND